jgi:type III pantothenate kinase
VRPGQSHPTWLASVADPALADALAATLTNAGAVVHRAATLASAHGLRNAYPQPAQMGVDRWLALLGAWRRYRQACCVVDAGTAVTLDVVDDSGQHLGGYIVPGPALMRRALLAGTGRIAAAAALPVPGGSGQRWGRDTEACIALGSGRALACLVADSVKALARGAARPPVLVVTGGDAADLLVTLDTAAEHRPQLVLEGLAGAAGLPLA